MIIYNQDDLKLNKIYEKYKLKKNNYNSLSINHRKFLEETSGLCAGLSMFWLFCMAKESNPGLSFGIRHFYNKFTNKNNKFLNFDKITRRYFKEISKYINNDNSDKNDNEKNANIEKLKNSLKEYHKISNEMFKTTTCGVCSLNDRNKGFDFKEFFIAITTAIDSNKNREVYITISSFEHAMALYARRSNLNGLLDGYYEFIFFDPNDDMGESMPLILNLNRNRSYQEIFNKFSNLFGKERRKNYFTGYQDYFHYSIFEFSDLKPYMMTNLNRPFSKDYESIKSLKILGIDESLDKEMKIFHILYNSCKLGIYPVVSKVLKEFKDFNPNQVTTNKVGANATLLYIASQNGHTEIVKALIKELKGIDPNKATVEGDTPLIIATWGGHTEIVKVLIEFAGIDPMKENNHSMSPLKCVTYIIENYVKLNSSGVISKPKGEYETIKNILLRQFAPPKPPRAYRFPT